METGGFKGLGRAVFRAELYDGIAAATGVPTSRIVNEYGMTELLSQLYEPTLSEGTPNTRTWEASDLTSEASVRSAGNIQLSTTDTSGEILLVLWLDITE